MAEEMKKLKEEDCGFATRVTLTSSQSFNYPSRGKEMIFKRHLLWTIMNHCTIHKDMDCTDLYVTGGGSLLLF